MMPIATVKLIISILVKLHLIPKCQIMAKLDVTVLEDELKQLNKINKTQQETIAGLRRDYKDMEKQYQTTFLLEQDGQALIKKQAAQISEQTKQINNRKNNYHLTQLSHVSRKKLPLTLQLLM